MTLKSISELFEDLKPVAVAVSSDVEVELLDDAGKRAEAYSLRLQGVPTEKIAKTFGVTPATINRWLHKHIDEFREEIEKIPAANMVAESIKFLDNVEEICLYEINLLSDGGAAYDIEKGKIVRPKAAGNQSLMAKVRFVEALIKARQTKMDLLVKTGIIPTQPERIYHRMVDEKRDERGVSELESGKSIDQVKQSLITLIKSGRSI